MKKLTSLLMLAALTSGALALSSGQSFARGRALSPSNPAKKVAMQKHRRVSEKSKTTQTGRKRKASHKVNKPTVMAPGVSRQG